MELNVFMIGFILLALLVLAFFISGRMTRRAVIRVIEIFRQKRAIGIHQAKTIDELGLTPPGFLERAMRARDYKQNALKILIKNEIIHVTGDGKLYITEEKNQELAGRGI
jgi:hypothetical protein